MGRHLLVFFLFVGHVLGGVDDVFSSEDAKHTANIVSSRQQKDGMWSTLAETDHAIFVLKSLGVSIKKSEKICRKLGQPLPKDFESLYHTVRASKALGCADIDISSIQPSLQDAISGNEITLTDAFYAWKVILITGTVDDFDCQTTVGLVVELMEDDGSFRDATDSDDSSVVNAGYAIQLAAEIFIKVEGLQDPSSGVSEEMRELADKVKDITELEPTLGSELSPIAATASLVRGFHSLSLALEEELDIDKDYVESTALFFLDNKHVDNIIDASFLLAGLDFCTNSIIDTPWSLIVTDNLNVRLTNVMNEVMDADAKVELVAVLSSDDEEVLSGIELTSAGDGNYKIKSDQWNNANPGYYSLTYKVTPKSENEPFKEDEIFRSTKVTGKITKTTFEGYTVDSLKASKDERSLFHTAYPKSLSKTVKLDKKFLVVNVKFESNVSPSQVFIQFAKGDKSTVFVAKAGEDGFYTFKAELESADFYPHIFGSGKYTISLIVGDALLDKSFSWSVGKFNVEISAEVQETVKEPVENFKKLPDIVHQFKTPDDRPPTILALIYTGIVLLPLGWLLLSIVGTVSIKLPASFTEFVSAMVFQGTLVAFLVLFALYWLCLSIFQALLGVCFLSIVAILSGNKSLKLLHARKSKSKKD